MSGSSRNSRLPENWEPGQDYWIYLPSNLSDFLPARRSLNPRERIRDPWLLFDERFIGVPNRGFASFPPAATPRPSVPLLLVDERAWPDSPPTQYQPWNGRASTEESRLSPEEQKQAVNKLKKQLYSPHINSIIKRLGTKGSSGSSPASTSQDELGKRCAVCLEDFETNKFVTITPCNHMFHEDCIVPWVKSHGKCPVCRFMIVDKTPTQRSRNDIASRRGGAERSLLF